MRGITKPKTPYVGIATTTDSSSLPMTKPQSVSEAQWRKAMEEELNALKKNCTWSLVPYNDNLKVVDCKWIFKTKFKGNREVERYKACSKRLSTGSRSELWEYI